MTGAAAQLTVKQPYFFGERMGRIEFTWFLNGKAIKRNSYRMVRQLIEAALSPFRNGAKRSIQISVVTLGALKGINIQSAISI